MANKEMVELIVSVLEEESFAVLGVIAISSLQIKLPEVKEEADLVGILKKIDTFKNYNILTTIMQPEKVISYKILSFKNPQFIGLISVFVLLIIILCFQIYAQVFSQKPVPKQTVQKLKPLQVVSIPTATLSSSLRSEKR